MRLLLLSLYIREHGIVPGCSYVLQRLRKRLCRNPYRREERYHQVHGYERYVLISFPCAVHV